MVTYSTTDGQVFDEPTKAAAHQAKLGLPEAPAETEEKLAPRTQAFTADELKTFLAAAEEATTVSKLKGVFVKFIETLASPREDEKIDEGG